MHVYQYMCMHVFAYACIYIIYSYIYVYRSVHGSDRGSVHGSDRDRGEEGGRSPAVKSKGHLYVYMHVRTLDICVDIKVYMCIYANSK
jgi:hypothetical protein